MRPMMIVLAALLGSPAFAAHDTRVQVCHLPPANPANYHTITVSAAALTAHLAHGDYVGPCGNWCAVLCDDGNACTQDTGVFDPTTGRCDCSGLPVDCSVTSACLSAAACDPELGCQYAVNAGASCNADDNACTGPDTCDADGVCQAGAAVPECCVADSDCPNDACVHSECISGRCSTPGPTAVAQACVPADACSTATCDRVQGCVVTATVCPAPDLCHPGTCDLATGACSNPAVSCAQGTCPTPCGGQCVNTELDPTNCGGCGVTCAPGQKCAGGTCSAGVSLSGPIGVSPGVIVGGSNTPVTLSLPSASETATSVSLTATGPDGSSSSVTKVGGGAVSPADLGTSVLVDPPPSQATDSGTYVYTLGVTGSSGASAAATGVLTVVADAPCAAPAVLAERFAGNMAGCAATVPFDSRGSLCGPGWSVCTAAQWISWKGSQFATHHYWLAEPLGWGGISSAVCFVDYEGTPGITSCASGTSMLVCTGYGSVGIADPEGNVCRLNACSWGTSTGGPNQQLGGCGDSAGALCCVGDSPFLAP